MAGDITTTFKTDLKYKDFPFNASLGDPLTVQFYDNSLGDPDDWYWDFGDGHYSNEQNPSHTYTGNMGNVTFYSWKDAPYSVRVPAGYTGGRKTLIIFSHGTDDQWQDAWETMEDKSWNESGGWQLCERSAKNPSNMGELDIGYSTLRFTVADDDPFLTILRGGGSPSTFVLYNTVGCINAAGLTVSMLDLGKEHNQRRDFNITQLTDPNGTVLGDVTHLDGDDIYLSFYDDLNSPYRTFKDIFPLFDGGCWPYGAGNKVGYWGNCVQTFSLRRYVSDHWGSMTVDFSDKSKLFDFIGTPRVGTAMLTVQFIDLSVLEVTEWDWDFGDGTISGVTAGSTHEHPTHMYVYDSI
jgi:hypothetical protein